MRRFFPRFGISKGKTLVVVSVLLSVVIFTHSAYTELTWSERSRPTAMLVQAIGFSGLSLSSECTSARNPILEPTCLSDMPGGYCFHLSCGLVGVPIVGNQTNQIEVLHR